MLFGHLNRVQSMGKEMFGVNVIFVHCYAYLLNLGPSVTIITQIPVPYEILEGNLKVI